MVLLAFILCGLAAGLACGGSLRAMAQHNIALLWLPVAAYPGRLRGRMQRVCSPRLRLMRPWPYVCCIMACCLFLWRPICAAVFGVLCSAPGPG